jgi:molybdate transport system regulatory protein
VDGGGAFLTPEARDIMKRYQAFIEEASEMLEQLFKKHFS